MRTKSERDTATLPHDPYRAIGITTPPAPAVEATERVRSLIVAAVEAGRPLTDDEAREINASLAGRTIAASVRIAKRLSEAVAAGNDLTSSMPELTQLLTAGPAAAIVLMAAERKALSDAFETTHFAKRRDELKRERDAAHQAYEAARSDENTAPQKLARLGRVHLLSMQALSEHINSADPDLIQYRRALRPTSDPARLATDWRSFLI